jgi:hypothetical protein
MNTDKIIGIQSIEERLEVERRQSQRRASDRDLTALAARVDALESAASNYRLSIAREEHIRRERKYQVLQAAAMLQAGPMAVAGGLTPQESVTVAERLLAEIERREKERSSDGS